MRKPHQRNVASANASISLTIDPVLTFKTAKWHRLACQRAGQASITSGGRQNHELSNRDMNSVHCLMTSSLALSLVLLVVCSAS